MEYKLNKMGRDQGRPVDVIILTITSDEKDAVINHFRPDDTVVDRDESKKALHHYWYGQIDDIDGDRWGILIAMVGSMGATVSALDTQDLLSEFRPKWLVLCGISGGVVEPSLMLGDIYLSTRIHDFSVTKKLQGENPHVIQGGGEMSNWAVSIAEGIDIYEDRLRDWSAPQTIKCERPTIDVPTTPDLEMFYASSLQERQRAFEVLTQQLNENRTRPMVRHGAIYSNNTLAKDTELLHLWKEHGADAWAVEMEAAGVRTAVSRFSETEFICVKGISDIVGIKRTEAWKHYACHTAASFTYHMIKGGLLREKVSPILPPSWMDSLPQHLVPLLKMSDVDFTKAARVLSAMLMSCARPSTDLKKIIKKQRDEDKCTELWQKIRDDDNFQLAIYGVPGSGKTTLLTLLSLLAHRDSANGSKFSVEYINLHHFDEHVNNSVDEIKKRLSKDIGDRIKLANGKPIYLFVDGFDQHPRERHQGIQSYFRNEIRDKGVRVLGIGLLDHNEGKRTIADDDMKEVPANQIGTYLLLESLSLQRSISLQNLFLRYQTCLAKTDGRSVLNSDKLTLRLKKSELKRIDLFRLNVLASATTPVKKGFSAALKEFLTERVNDTIQNNNEHTADEVLRLISKNIFLNVVAKNPLPDIPFNISCWGLLFGQPIVRSYLIAMHVISVLVEIGEALPNDERTWIDNDEQKAHDCWKESGLAGKLFNAEENTFCKQFLGHQEQKQVLRAIKAIVARHNKNDAFELSHLCYLLGRLLRHQPESMKILSKLHNEYINYEHGYIADQLDKAEFYRIQMLQWTILISEISASLDNERGQYIRQYILQIRDTSWRRIANGFITQYYGDVYFDHGFMHSLESYQDELMSYRFTLDQIVPRIERMIEGDEKPYSLFDVDLATVCSLANSRQEILEQPNFDQRKCRNRARGIVELCCNNNKKIRHRSVWPFLRMTQRFLRSDRKTTAFSFITKLYELKYDTPRAGWPEMLTLRGRIESVADHTFSTMILAEMLLPEERPIELSEEEEYSKADIVRKLLIHDISEAITGDRPSISEQQEADGQYRLEEKNVAGMLSHLSTLSGVSGFGDLLMRWERCEDRHTTNAKIANFLDKVDALFQMVVYGKRYSDQRNSNWTAFYEKLFADVQTAAGDHPFLLKLMYTCTEWAKWEWESPNDYLQHEDMFDGYMKYYPGFGKRGKPIPLEAGIPKADIWGEAN
ncbi:HD domain-containing protein [Gimesia fumaroli]|nr:HD domain-containing protein [Gimesia fumaroli]